MEGIFKALNDTTRREIMNMLKVKSMSAGDIADNFNMSKPSISHHLEILKQADLIVAEKKGQFIIYTLNTIIIDDVLTWLLTFKN
jgi:ArsR family transcriptional regulator, arsenate/arsenite/antimonite-responsive transcriptional repressor